MLDRAIALYGTTEPVPERIELKAGAVTATLENGALRWIRLSGVEVLRGIAFLVRDRKWGTPGAEISDLDIRQTDSGFRVTFKALCRTGDGELSWSAEITGEASGRLQFTGTASPVADFVTNRTGFVVLHPLDRVAGCPVEVIHVDGSKRLARFPEDIDPEQCFFDLRALSHEPVPGLWATCTMAGDTWETEDHRNWLDASFKTYVRPLSLPYPYTLKGGVNVVQSVVLSFSGTLPKPLTAAAPAPVEVTLGDLSRTRMPAIGLRAPLQWMDEADAVVDLVRRVGPQLLNGRIDPRLGHGVKEIKRLGALAAALRAGLALELVVPCRRDPADELAEFTEALRESGVRPESVVVAAAEDRIRGEPGAPPPPLALLAAIHRAARAMLPDLPVGGGSFGFFTELNRNWPPIGLIDYIAHTVSSTVHASDDRSMMENLDTFRHIARTVQAFAGDKPHRLIASDLGLDINPGGEPAPNPENRRGTMVRMDPRHRALFGAAWALAAIGEAARGGLAAISPAAPVGEFGLVHRRLDYAQPWFDDLERPAVYPVYHVVAGMAEAAGRPLIRSTVSDRARVASLAYREAKGGTSLWLANLTDAAQRVVLPDRAAGSRIGCLDEATFAAAAVDPAFLHSRSIALTAREIELGAYAIAWIQIGR